MRLQIFFGVCASILGLVSLGPARAHIEPNPIVQSIEEGGLEQNPQNPDIRGGVAAEARNRGVQPILALAASKAPAPPGTDELDFLDDLEKVEALASNRRWSRVRKELAKLLEEHTGERYVLRRLPTVNDLFEQCTFWSSFDPPKPADVVVGDLLSYNEKSGSIKIKYKAKNRAKKRDEGLFDPAEVQFAKLLASKKIQFHPAHFAGQYTMQVEGKMSGSKGRFGGGAELPPSIVAAVGPDEFFRASAGLPKKEDDLTVRWFPGRIVRVLGEKVETVAESDKTPIQFGRPYSLKITVGSKNISLNVNGRRYLSARRKKGDYGRVGFEDCPSIDEILIVGKVNTSWIAGLVSRRVEAARSDFEGRYRIEDDLPGWLVEFAAGTTKKEEPALAWKLPGERPGSLEHINQLEGFLAKKRYEDGKAYVIELDEEDAPKAVREWFECLFREGLRDLVGALVCVRRVVAIDAEYVAARHVEGRLLLALGRRNEAREALEACLTIEPTFGAAYEDLALLYLSEGSPVRAEAMVQSALDAGVATDAVEVASTALLRMRSGPTWERTFDRKSTHYHVASDMDAGVCVEVSTLLEQSFRIYQTRLRRLPGDDDRKRFRVFLFSGQAGFASYSEDIQLFARAPKIVAGLYIPTLKQLLIWNLPDRDAMLRTIRHEGLHQYLDILSHDVPTWLNEGLAEYFETAGIVGGHVSDGAPLRAHLVALRSGEWTPLDELVGMGPGQFYARPGMHYAEGWATAHYLMQGGAEPRERLETMFDALAAGEPGEAVNKILFSDETPSALEARVRAHVRELDGQ